MRNQELNLAEEYKTRLIFKREPTQKLAVEYLDKVWIKIFTSREQSGVEKGRGRLNLVQYARVGHYENYLSTV